MQTHPGRPPCRPMSIPWPFALRRWAAAGAALLALWAGAPQARAQSSAMDPNLVVAVLGFDPTPAFLTAAQAAVVDQLVPRRIFLLRATSGTPDQLVGRLALIARVVHVGRNRQVLAPEVAGQFFGAVKNSVNAIGAREASAARLPVGWTTPWLNARTLHTLSRGTGITVAVLDTGIDLLHSAFVGRLRTGRDFVSGDTTPAEDRLSRIEAGAAFGHGTHVAGIVATTAPGARIMPLRVLDPSGRGTLWTVAKGIDFALDPDRKPLSRDGARVLNMSFGVSALQAGEDGVLRTLMKLSTCHPDVAARVTPFNDAGYDNDRLRCADPLQRPVATAGEGNIVGARPLYPAAYSASLPALIAVTASDPRGFRTEWSTRNAFAEVVAPGQWIQSAYPNGDPRGNTAVMSGTSMATPWVSGVAALLLASPAPAAGAWTGAGVRNRMRATAAAVCGSAGLELAPLRALRNETGSATACR